MFGEKVGEKVRVWLGNCGASSPTFLRHRATPAARAVEQLRLVTAELEMAPLRHAVHILTDAKRSVIGAADPTDIELFASLDQRLDRLATDLSCWANALNRVCVQQPAPSGYADRCSSVPEVEHGRLSRSSRDVCHPPRARRAGQGGAQGVASVEAWRLAAVIDSARPGRSGGGAGEHAGA